MINPNNTSSHTVGSSPNWFIVQILICSSKFCFRFCFKLLGDIKGSNIKDDLRKLKDKLIMKKITILILVILSLNSCQSEDGQQIVTIENRYSIVIPSFLTKARGLNDDASLQYQHTWKEFYVIVIDEPKTEMQKALDDNNLNEIYTNDVKGYSELLLFGFEQALNVSHKSVIVDTLINNMPARLLTINGRVDGVNIFYSLAFIQGSDRYYQIMSWTMARKEEEYKDKMNRIMYSLKEL